jgi:hypothetical protein
MTVLFRHARFFSSHQLHSQVFDSILAQTQKAIYVSAFRFASEDDGEYLSESLTIRKVTAVT